MTKEQEYYNALKEIEKILAYTHDDINGEFIPSADALHETNNIIEQFID